MHNNTIIENKKKDYICTSKNIDAFIITQCLGKRHVIIKNISENGVYFEISFPNTDSPLISFLCLRNERIYLNINLNHQCSVEAIGIAKWSEEIDNPDNIFSKTYGLGVEFIEITPDNKEKLVSFIKEEVMNNNRSKLPKIPEDPFVEKRVHPRFNINASLKANYVDPLTNSNTLYSGSIINISEGGACFITEDHLPLKSILSFLIDFASPPCQIKGSLEILWNKSENGKFYYGGRFTELSEFDRLSLQKIFCTQNTVIKPHIEPILSLIDTHIVNKLKDIVTKFFTNELTNYFVFLLDLETRLQKIQDEQRNIQNQLINYSEKIAEKGSEVENIINHPLIMKEIKKTFRSLISNWAYQSPLIKRAFEKPRGYAGDYKMIELIYDNKPLSDYNNIGYYYDNWLLKNIYAVAVRNRKDFMKEYLFNSICNTEATEFNVLNLACGSCREIRELVAEKTIPSHKKIKFVCVDMDEESLCFSKQALSSVPDNIEITFIKENILNMLRNPIKFSKSLGKYDLIYSIGLADYFPDILLKNFIKFCFNLTLSNGKLIIAHKDIDKYKPIPHDWFCDWTFYPRNEEKLLTLVEKSEIDNYSIEVKREPSGVIFFVLITKNSKDVASH